MEPHVQDTGDSAFAWNSTRNEAAVFHSSRDKNVGKKFTLSNCFVYKSIRQPRDYIPVCDEYKAMFAGCDAFNQQLHNNTFLTGFQATPTWHKRRIFGIISLLRLVSSWNAWRAALRDRDKLPSFTEFCDSLHVV